VSNFASGDKIAQGANMIRKVFKGIRTAAKEKKKFFFADKADQMTKGVGQVMSGLRKEFDNLYNAKGLGNKAIQGSDDLVAVQDVAARLPKEVANKVQKIVDVSDSSQVFGTLGKGREALAPTLGTVRTIKTQIGKQVRKKVWERVEPPTELERQLMNDYHTLNDVMARNAGEFADDLLALNAKAKKLYRAESIIKGVTQTPKGVTKTTIRDISSEAQQGTLREFLKFGDEFFPQTKEIIRDINKFKTIQKVKKAALIGIPTAAAVGVATSKIREGLKDVGGGGSGGGIN